MKRKLFFSMLAFLAICGNVNAQTAVSVADVEALPGETVSFTVSLSNGVANTYTAIDINAYFPADGFTTTGSYSISSVWTGASGTVGDVDASGLATMTFTSSEAIPETDVDNLITINFTVAPTVALGQYDVTLKNTELAYGISDHIIVDDVTFKVNVVDVHTVILDEESTSVPASTSDPVNVKVKRTINANDWSTICLPFAMTEEQLKTAFGDDVKLADFQGTDPEYDTDDKVISIAVNFDYVTSLEANHPYIIKVSVPVSEFTVNNVVIDSDEESAIIEFDNGKTGSRRQVYSGFYGIYKANTLLDEFMVFLSGNKFWYSDGSALCKAFRAYFDLVDILDEVENPSSAPIFFVFDKETTGITSVYNVNKVSSPFYSISGQMVKNPSKGLYIKDGKKVIIK